MTKEDILKLFEERNWAALKQLAVSSELEWPGTYDGPSGFADAVLNAIPTWAVAPEVAEVPDVTDRSEGDRASVGIPPKESELNTTLLRRLTPDWIERAFEVSERLLERLNQVTERYEFILEAIQTIAITLQTTPKEVDNAIKKAQVEQNRQIEQNMKQLGQVINTLAIYLSEQFDFLIKAEMAKTEPDLTSLDWLRNEKNKVDTLRRTGK